MGFWDKSLRIFKSLCDNGTQGVRRIAQQTGLSKSSVQRLKQAMERRNVHPETGTRTHIDYFGYPLKAGQLGVGQVR